MLSKNGMVFVIMMVLKVISIHPTSVLSVCDTTELQYILCNHYCSLHGDLV